jgi:hypothetical protein
MFYIITNKLELSFGDLHNIEQSFCGKGLPTPSFFRQHKLHAKHIASLLSMRIV